MWLSVVGFFIAIIFLFRSLEITQAGQPFLNALICLFSMLAALCFLPEVISLNILRGFAWFVYLFAGGFLLSDAGNLILNRVKRSGFFKSKGSSGLSMELNEICKSLELMSADRVGALIVLEGKQSLQHLIESGVRFDGDIKSEVIISLFSKNSPVHDGAMLISQNRIKALKVILPLTTRADVPMGIGTRHRSAIGLTEATDAVALIASEERGMTSVAYQGALVTANSKEQLSELLKLALNGKPIAESD